MSEYIKREDVIKVIENGYCFVPEATWAIRNIPSINIVRCEECERWLGEPEMYEDREYRKCYNFGGFYTAPNNFCSYGERRE